MLIQNVNSLILMKFWARYRQSSIQEIKNSQIMEILSIIQTNNNKKLCIHQIRSKQLTSELILALIIRNCEEFSKENVNQMLKSQNKAEMPKNLQIKLQLIEYFLNKTQHPNSDLLLQSFKGLSFLNKSLFQSIKKYIEQNTIINEDSQSLKDKIQQNIHQLLFHKTANIKENMHYIERMIRATKVDKNKNNNLFYNKRFCQKIKHLVLNSNNISLIELFFSIINQLSKNNKNNSEFINPNYDDEIVSLKDLYQNQQLYQFFSSKNSNLHRMNSLRQMPSLQYYLFKNGLLSQYCLIQNYFPSLNNKCMKPSLTFTTVGQLIRNKDSKIWSILKQNMYTLPPLALQYFLIQSGLSFNNSRIQRIKQKIKEKQKHEHQYQSVQQNNKQQNEHLSDPLQFFSIKKQFWMDSFSGELLSACLWILTETWLKKVKNQIAKNQTLEKISNQEYRTILNLVIFQFMLSINSKPNLLIKYALIENNLYNAMFRLPSFATLAYRNKNLQQWPWKDLIFQQIPNILSQENGYYLVNTLKKSSLKNSSSNHNNIIGFMIEQAQNQLKNKNSLIQDRKKQLLTVLSTITELQSNNNKKLNPILKLLNSQ